MMCAGSSELSLVANSISTQISCAGSNFDVLAASKMDDKEREKFFFFFYFI